jgi:hypothetical protein
LAVGQLYRDTRRPSPARAAYAAAQRVIDGIGERLQTLELKEGFERSPLIRSVVERCQID